MRRSVVCAALLLGFSAVGFADDQEKAEKQIRMMTAMSRDDTARAIVSRAFADSFKIARPQLVAERKSLALNYGSFFLAHELVQSGPSMEQLTAQLRAGKNILEIARDWHADWKRIALNAKKMNNRISDAIYKHFLHSQPDEERDKLEHYNPATDLVRADAEVTPNELVKAMNEYIFWRDQAAPINGGRADASTPIGQAYDRTRDNVATSHGGASAQQGR